MAREVQEKQAHKEEIVENTDSLDQLVSLAKLKEDGIINEEEFEKMKKKIIGS